MANDRIGEKFGRYLVIAPCDFDKRRVLCRCDCGTEKYVYKNNLFSGKTYSCGCLAKERTMERSRTHGQASTRLYMVWANMRRRCYDKHNNRYQNYGGRGIKVCDEWLDFAGFKKWADENGYDPKADYGKCTIDRINPDGDYEPQNCRWTTIQEQNMNRTSTKYITYKGMTKTVTQWDEYLGFGKDRVASRLRKGWSIERAIETPIKRKAVI
jgi:hypothetical protein